MFTKKTSVINKHHSGIDLGGRVEFASLFSQLASNLVPGIHFWHIQKAGPSGSGFRVFA